MNETMQSSSAVRDWYTERYQAVFVSRNRCLVAAVVGLILSALQALALVLLVPLKTSVPFVIKEETSGAVMTVAPLKGNASITYDEAAQKYFLAKYVVARETYDPADLADSYRAVDLMSDPDTARAFNQAIAESNRRSPIAVYGQHTRRIIRVKSISFLNDHLAQVRLTATEMKNTGASTDSQWIAVVGFRFGSAPVLESERLINPLGFLVTSYRIDQEVVP